MTTIEYEITKKARYLGVGLPMWNMVNARFTAQFVRNMMFREWLFRTITFPAKQDNPPSLPNTYVGPSMVAPRKR